MEKTSQIKAPKEILHNLEQEGLYVFHGSTNGNILSLEPQQAYNFVDGEKVADGEPGIHASPFADLAIFRALINNQNFKDINNYHSSFSYIGNGKMKFEISEDINENISNNTKGFVYVFENEHFEERSPSQYISYENQIPIMAIEVTKSDLPENITITQP